MDASRHSDTYSQVFDKDSTAIYGVIDSSIFEVLQIEIYDIASLQLVSVVSKERIYFATNALQKRASKSKG